MLIEKLFNRQAEQASLMRVQGNLVTAPSILARHFFTETMLYTLISELIHKLHRCYIPSPGYPRVVNSSSRTLISNESKAYCRK